MMIGNKYLYIIGGPTASGKTALAVNEAIRLNTVVISADSRQFYREMSIGTAKPSQQELDSVPHFFINNLSIHDEYDVGTYESEVIHLLDDLYKKHDIVIMAGGSGLFIKAVTDGLDDFPEIESEVKEKCQLILDNEGIEGLQQFVRQKDPQYFAEVDIQNPRRLLRAAEVILQSGQTYSGFRKKSRKIRNFATIKYLINPERELLYDRINLRVLQMVAQGLEAEARQLYAYRHSKPLQTVGYQEWFDYFDGKITRNQAIELIQQNTRRYAKRQLTWFRNDGGWSTDLPGILK